MKEKNALVSMMLIDSQVVEVGCNVLHDGDYYFGEPIFDAENLKKLEQSSSFRSQLYFDALSNVH